MTIERKGKTWKTYAPSPERNKLYYQIKSAQRTHGITDEVYRVKIENLFEGRTSSTQLHISELRPFAVCMEENSATLPETLPETKYYKKSGNKQARMIFAMWGRLVSIADDEELKAVRKDKRKVRTLLREFCAKMAGLPEGTETDPDMMSPEIRSKVIEALKVRIARAEGTGK